jgi:hypothetical protein
MSHAEHDGSRFSTEPPSQFEHWLQLATKPRDFFLRDAHLTSSTRIIATAWLVGISNVIDRLDMESAKVELGGRSTLLKVVDDSWLAYWSFAVILGGFSAWLYWLLVGAWYKKRLEWSGAENPDPQLARAIMTHSALLVAAPVVLIAALDTVRHEDYSHAYAAASLLGLLVFPMLALGIHASYQGVMVRFDLKRAKAIGWFVVLPTTFYVLVFGGVFVAILTGLLGS